MSEILPAVKTAVAEITAVVDERHEKYGSSNVARSPGGPLNGLRVRLHDKLARLNNYVDNGGVADFGDDKLRDCFIDVAGYALIGLLVLDGRWPGLEKSDGPGDRVQRLMETLDVAGYNPEPMGGECHPLVDRRDLTVTIKSADPNQYLINKHLNEGSR